MSAEALPLPTQPRQPDRAGKLIGDVSIELHTGDAVSLFKGRPASGGQHFSAGLEHYSARTLLVKRFAVIGDPVAAEILVETETRFNQLGALLIATSTEPCSGFNPYGMLAVRNLLELEKIILSYRRAAHVSLVTKQESNKQIEKLCRSFRSVMFPAFLYKPSVDRNDFDTGSDKAIEWLTHYRRVLYIRQNDSRTNDELSQHYSTYDAVPAY